MCYLNGAHMTIANTSDSVASYIKTVSCVQFFLLLICLLWFTLVVFQLDIFSSTMVALSGKWLAAAAPYVASHGFWNSGLGACDVSNASIPLPAGQSTLVAPQNLSVTRIAVAVGVQNYTCTSYNNYT
jgi:hypothetical protein